MSFDYVGNLTALTNCLKDHNTVTASPDLCQSMTTRIAKDGVVADDLEIVGAQGRNLPAIFARMVSADEEYESLGVTGPTGNRKLKTVTYEIVGLYRRDGVTASHESLMSEVYQLAANIEGVLQAEMKLSNTALWCNARRTDFSGAFEIDAGAWVKGVRVEVEARYFFR